MQEPSSAPEGVDLRGWSCLEVKTSTYSLLMVRYNMQHCIHFGGLSIDQTAKRQDAVSGDARHKGAAETKQARKTVPA